MDNNFKNEIKQEAEKLHKDFSNERAIWLGITILLLSITLFFAFKLLKIAPNSAVFSPLISGSENDDEDASLYKINYVYKTILQNYLNKPNANDLAKTAINAMLNSLNDPYSTFLADSTARSMNDTIAGEFGGLGITISKKKLDVTNSKDANEKDFFVKINSVIEGSPSRKAGILSGDYITLINNQDVKTLSSEETVTWLRGKAGSSVKLTIMRGQSTFDIDVKREIINVNTVKYSMIENTNIAYVKILQFTPKTPDQVKDALINLSTKNYDKLIFDVRDNGGGSLDACVEIIDEILDKGIIVSTEGRNKKQNNVNVAKEDSLILATIPIIVLINENSASASEIFAGALKDNKRATLIGTKTYGKGKVQAVYPLTNDYSESFKLTVATYFTPNHIDIDKQGINPDIEVVEYPKLEENEANKKSMQSLLDSGDLENFLTNYPNPSADQINNFVDKLSAKGNSLDRDYLIKLVVILSEGRMANPPVYDLRFDKALNKAITSF